MYKLLYQIIALVFIITGCANADENVKKVEDFSYKQRLIHKLINSSNLDAYFHVDVNVALTGIYSRKFERLYEEIHAEPNISQFNINLISCIPITDNVFIGGGLNYNNTNITLKPSSWGGDYISTINNASISMPIMVELTNNGNNSTISLSFISYLKKDPYLSLRLLFGINCN